MKDSSFKRPVNALPIKALTPPSVINCIFFFHFFPFFKETRHIFFNLFLLYLTLILMCRQAGEMVLSRHFPSLKSNTVYDVYVF